MHYLFKTTYKQDLRVWRHGGDIFWYSLLAVVLLVLPMVAGEFYVGELAGVFVFAIAGVGLMLLIGYTGLVSLGHAAFLGIGAYTNAVLLAQGVPFLLSLPAAGILTALAGIAIGVPTLRMSGLYLAIATLAFGGIMANVFSKWTSVTGGFDGFAVQTATEKAEKFAKEKTSQGAEDVVRNAEALMNEFNLMRQDLIVISKA